MKNTTEEIERASEEMRNIAAKKQQVETGIRGNENTRFLFNYTPDMAKRKNAQTVFKNMKLSVPVTDVPLTKEEFQAHQSNSLKKYFSLGIVVIISMILISSCARNTSFLNSSVVPAAQGSVKVKTDNNKNYVIHVAIKDLADVGRLQPPKKSYVVWMETEQGRTENLGQLVSSKSFLSRQMTATLETVSSYKPVRVFVTAENDSSPQYPDWLVVLTTEIF
jgi:hypothetical protein